MACRRCSVLLSGAVSALTVCIVTLTKTTAAETTVYSQDFESNNGSYVASGSLQNWEWGDPSPSFAAGPMAAHSGTKCWGTDLDDTVPFNSNAYLTSPAITLRALNANEVMRVRFFAWIAVDYLYDRGEFQVSRNGIDWETKAELLCVMQGGWNEYSFDISDYAGKVIYLRLRCLTDDQNNFNPPDAPYNMAGLYVDDIAITVATLPPVKKTLTFEGFEYQNVHASGPWIYVEGKNGYESDNTIFSTAKGNVNEYTDYYQLRKGVTANADGKLILKIMENEQEESYTDLINLIAVDHAANVEIAPDENGNIFTYSNNVNPVRPDTAFDANGDNVLASISNPDGDGYRAYNGDYIDLDFSSIGNAQHPVFLLKARGFMVDTQPGTPIEVQPKIEVQTQNPEGEWTTRNIFYPRGEAALCGYDMTGLVPNSKKIRLLSSSCFSGTYHLIDWAVISTQAQKPFTTTVLVPESAVCSDGTMVGKALSDTDHYYVQLGLKEDVTLTFNEPSKSNNNKRDFLIKSKGYYNPTGTYFFYTWDGTKWVQRDGWSVPQNGDQVRDVDLSLWLPDPSGDYKVRIWQDFLCDPAGIDYVGFRRDTADLVMNKATDLRTGGSALSLLNSSDDQWVNWDYGVGRWTRDRWVEVSWVDTSVTKPLSTNSLSITDSKSPASATKTGPNRPPVAEAGPNQTLLASEQCLTLVSLDGSASSDPDGDSLTFIWSGPFGTAKGSNPNVFLNPDTFMIRLTVSDTKGSSSTDSVKIIVYDTISPVPDLSSLPSITGECSVIISNEPTATDNCDGTVVGVTDSLEFRKPGTYSVIWRYADNSGNITQQPQTIIVTDVTAPRPDSATLPVIKNSCSVLITEFPTATDNCAGLITGTTIDPLSYTDKGTHVVTWQYEDDNGNVALQKQTVIVEDNTAPVPDVPQLPDVRGKRSVTITTKPTATDDCKGQITGTTCNPLTYNSQGTYTITWQYNDGNGNISKQTQTAIVEDNTAPVPDVAQLPVLRGNCSVTIRARPTATDDYHRQITGTTSDPLTYTEQGTYTVTWRYDNGSRNVSTQKQTVIVRNFFPPIPDVSHLSILRGDCSVTISNRPTATDACKNRIIGTTTDPLVYIKEGVYTINWIYNNGNGNISMQKQMVIVHDWAPPVPDVAQLPIVRGDCLVKISDIPTATDPCKGRITGRTHDPLTYTRSGIYIIHWIYNDGNGNVSMQKQTVIVKGNQAPIPKIKSLPAITGYLRNYHCFTVTAYPSATDNCKGEITGKTTSPLTYCHKGDFTIIWKYDNGSGNITTQQQLVYIR